MATQVQFRGGTTVEHSTFTGAAREITIDTDKDTVVVHDGATAGGYPLAKEDGATFINVDINSGTIDGTTIGATTPSTVSATDLTATGTTTLAGADTSADITFGDNVKATFGIGNDLQIYHDGSHSYVSDQGTGNLLIRGENVLLQKADGTENYFRAVPNAEVKIYYDGSEKLATTSTGITVTGTVTADGLALSDNILRDVDNNSMFISGGNAASTGANIGLYGSTSGNPNDILLRRNNVKFAAFDGATGDISFYEDTGTTAKFFWDASEESLGIGTSSPSTPLHISGASDVVSTIESTDRYSHVDFVDSLGSSRITNDGGNLRLRADNANAVASSYLTLETDGTERMRIDSSGNVGIGVTPVVKLDVQSSSGIIGRIQSTSGDAQFNIAVPNVNDGILAFGDASAYRASIKANTSDALTFQTGSSLTERMRIDSSGNVGIGTSSPASSVTGSAKMLQIEHNNFAGIALNNTGAGTKFEIASLASDGLGFYDNGTHRMRIDSSGNLLVGKTASSINNDGFQVHNTGYIGSTNSGASTAYFNRKTDDGDIVNFQKDGTTVGSIGTKTGHLTSGNGDVGLIFNDSIDSIYPWNMGTNSGRDNAIDLGNSGTRFDDIYATNGTIQTSDQNEKQQIASLTDAEITAAKAISKLFKTFKWNDSVAEKGDAARTHSGVIAQDVEQAMADAGLNAGDYAFFISTTWWETQTDVPAVEAVEAVEATYDEEGNVLTEAVEAVEGKEAYTRTDTYDTAEEAPEGATERNRKGIRYPQLLSFIGAATEQRLASIESRLDALEGS